MTTMLALELGVMALVGGSGFVAGWVWCWSHHQEVVVLEQDPEPTRVVQLHRVA
jgi:hypothetical protein